MWKYISISLLGIWTIAVFILNWVGTLQTARDLFQNRGEVMRFIGAVLTSQWFPLTLFIIVAGFFIVVQIKPLLFKSKGTLEGEIHRLVWPKDVAAHARLFLEVQITNNGIPPTIVRGYGVYAKLRDGTRIDGTSITVPVGQQMVSGNYKITVNKVIYEETTAPIADGAQAGGWIGFEFPASLEIVRRPDTFIVWEFHDAKGNRYFTEASATGDDFSGTAIPKYFPG